MAEEILLDEEDKHFITDYKFNISTSPNGNTRYALGYINGRTRLLHRLIMQPPANMLIDHINGNGLDNRKTNLRLANYSQNLANTGKHKNNKSSFKGVYWDKDKKKWRVTLSKNKKTIHIGVYVDKLEAAKAYDMAALKYHGEFARGNFF